MHLELATGFFPWPTISRAVFGFINERTRAIYSNAPLKAEVDGSKGRSQPGLDLVSKGMGRIKGEGRKKKEARTDLCKWRSLMWWV